MAGKSSGSKSRNILSSLVQLLLSSEAWIEFPIVEVEFETHHTRGPGTKFLCDPHMYWGIPAVLWLAHITIRTAQGWMWLAEHTFSASPCSRFYSTSAKTMLLFFGSSFTSPLLKQVELYATNSFLDL